MNSFLDCILMKFVNSSTTLICKICKLIFNTEVWHVWAFQQMSTTHWNFNLTKLYRNIRDRLSLREARVYSIVCIIHKKSAGDPIPLLGWSFTFTGAGLWGYVRGRVWLTNEWRRARILARHNVLKASSPLRTKARWGHAAFGGSLLSSAKEIILCRMKRYADEIHSFAVFLDYNFL